MDSVQTLRELHKKLGEVHRDIAEATHEGNLYEQAVALCEGAWCCMRLRDMLGGHDAKWQARMTEFLNRAHKAAEQLKRQRERAS